MITFIAERIKYLRKKNKLTQQQLADLVNLARPNITQWETGVSVPTTEHIIKLAKIFNVKTDFLLQYLPDKKSKKEEIKIPENQEIYPVGPTVILPIYGTISAGSACIADQQPDGFQVVDVSAVNGDVSNYFWLRTRGDSMQEIGIFEDSLLLIHKQDFINDNEVAVVIVNGDEATVKRVRFTGDMVMLIPENRNYSPQFYPRNDIVICGKVKKVLSSIS